MGSRISFVSLAVLALTAVCFAGGARAGCIEVDAAADWTEVHGGGPIVSAYASGLWTAHPDLRTVGPRGHHGVEGDRIAPPYPLGALLIASEARQVWSYRDFERVLTGHLLANAPAVFGRLFVRINDAADGLADNSGSVTFCLERPDG
ncbi:MAG: hypothetical protein ACFBSD_09395 [Paracoccaceae bacterium]